MDRMGISETVGNKKKTTKKKIQTKAAKGGTLKKGITVEERKTEYINQMLISNLKVNEEIEKFYKEKTKLYKLKI